MRARFQDSVRVRIDVAKDTTQVLVPTMLLQPIVENAFRRGVGARSA
jgi:LytS/YehU family sensor histidine kinase